MLVGRERELAAVDDALRAVNAGERAVLMLSGEPGIGKTCLLEQLAARMHAAGGCVAWGRMWEVALTPAFWPFIQVLEALARADEPTPQLGSLESRADASARLARFGEVAAFLTRRARERPLAILLDDLHAADPASLQLLEYLLPLLVGRRVLFALAARDADCAGEIADALGRIQRSARRLALARLDRAQVTQLVAARADSQRVFELSEGNPLFVEELLASASAAGALRLPALSSVRTVIRARLSQLQESARAALLAASVVGRDFRGQVVAEMLGDAELGARLASAQNLGMVAMTEADRYRFSHALVAEAIADELDASERARLHLRAARALERCEPSEFSAIAHHLLAAGNLAAEAAVAAAERAAHQCMAQLAFENAAALLERALSALQLAAPTDAGRRALLLCARAEALQHAAHHAEALELCERAAALVRALDVSVPERPLWLARIALVRGLEFRFGMTDPRLVESLQEALAALGERAPALRAKLLARLAAAEQPAVDPREPVARALEAIELARPLDPRDRLDVMYVATAALVDYHAPEPLDRIHHEVLELARGVDRTISLHTRLRLCFTALERVDRVAFHTAVQVFGAEASALGLPRWTRHSRMLEALTALIDGRWNDAQRAAAEAEAISTALGDSSALWMLGVHRMLASWVRTEPPDVRLIERFLDYPRGRAAINAWVAAQLGARERALSAIAEFPADLPVDPDFTCMEVFAITYANDAERAARAYAQLKARPAEIALASMVGSAVMDLRERMLLSLASTCGRWDVLDEHARKALAVAARLGSPVWTARVNADWAEARMRAGDAARARELWQSALADAERLDMPGLRARCLSALGEAPSAPQPSAASRVTLTQQGALWIVEGLGERVHVKASRGMEWLARLCEAPGRELHVLDLAAAGTRAQGDAGPVLDAQARAAYRVRLSELNAERDAAAADGDLGRSERVQEELEALQGELARAVGLGGRERKLGAASERARSNVQRRIAHAIDQVRAASARLGEHLETSISTGNYCRYEPKAG